MVQQMSLTSTDYDAGVDEFVKGGFTKEASELVKPYRVKEAPVQFECKVKDVVALGTAGGAGNLVICEIVKIHLQKAILNADNSINEHKLDLVARMGSNWYTRAIDGMFEVPKPLHNLGVGVDQIPEEFRLSTILTGNDLGKLGNVERVPSKEEINGFLEQDDTLKLLVERKDTNALHSKIQDLINQDNTGDAWKLILA
jgi:hypothetical protein